MQDEQKTKAELLEDLRRLRQRNAELETADMRSRQTDERFRFQAYLLQHVSDAIIATDTNLRITSWNHAAEKIYGWREEEVLGKELDALLHTQFQHLSQSEAQAFLYKHGRWQGEVHQCRKDGKWIEVMACVSLLQDQGGYPIGGVTINHDITDWKKAERANRMKSEFIAHISHEIRTPLNGILGYAQILKNDSTLTQKQLEAMTIIERSGQHLLQLLNDILDLSKIEAGRMEIESETFELSLLLEDIVEMSRIRAAEKGINVIWESAAAVPVVVKGDEKRLRQILLNLIGNAVKYTEQGHVRLRVETKGEGQRTKGREVSASRVIRFEVEDTGIGIAPDQLDVIFQPFEKANSKKFHADGTGLGLSISQRLVKMMGSQLHVSSTLDQGSVFWFDLELEAVHADHLGPVKPPSRIIGYKGPRRKILLVDDYYENLMVFRAMLAPLHFDIAEATDGREAIAKATQFRPDLILIDILMPGMDGWEATRQIRQIPQLRDVVILAISASVSEHARIRSLEAGCTDFLPKPLHFESLITELERHLHLEWIYEQPVLPPAESLIPPPQDILLVLLKFARIGQILDLQRQIEQLEETSQSSPAFAKRLRQMAENFEMEEICEFLQPYLTEEQK